MESLQRSVWVGLSTPEKEEWMQTIVRKLPEQMRYDGLQTFERYGQRTETGVFVCGGQKFVFVPGDRVTLGWDGWQEGMNEATSTDLLETVSEYGIEDVDSFLSDQMSPVREVEIAPMLVECCAHSLGWIKVTEEEARKQGDPDFAAALEEFKQGKLNEYEQYQQFRLVRHGGDIQILWFNEDLTLEDLLEETVEEEFGVLTEDEWEYLYGGGCRTLFPWGDSFDYTLKLKHFGDLQEADKLMGNSTEPPPALVDEADRPYDLELPNFFGVQFVGDPYTYELTLDDDGDMQPKGGDGGSMICGGMGPLVGFLPAAAVFYRDTNASDLDWEDMMDCMHYRRVIRLIGGAHS
ncbi:hypothetical protein MH215_26060 [Paenibacillus sp. ACRSA]|uniref:hypothetical protein n=1 Tax=Paenibacillus sp. ACRSA TaxID=2918211 RepID=UPI001EF49C39|nr:hypothetical protein [Paenibacillus sp. ACRSA]MCG7380445.1 hypothetical protein [Paenibacillus sp. ACRSA]